MQTSIETHHVDDTRNLKLTSLKTKNDSPIITMKYSEWLLSEKLHRISDINGISLPWTSF